MKKDHMNKMKSWIDEHLILFWGIVSVCFAVIIQILFSIPAKCDFLDAKWEAGDILTYVSTVSLSLLAVWQNKKFKEENDAAQKRLEELTNRANEISLINKIVEDEQVRIMRIKENTEKFSHLCNPSVKMSILADAISSNYEKNEAQESILTLSLIIPYFKLSTEINELYAAICDDVVSSEILDMDEIYEFLKECEKIRDSVLKFTKKMHLKIVNNEKIVVLEETLYLMEEYDSFTKAHSGMLLLLGERIKSLLYENWTLDEIKNTFYLKKEKINGKNANGNT